MPKTEKEQKEIIDDAIDGWLAASIISASQAATMRANSAAGPSQRQQLAQYFFIIAVSSALLAFGALFLDEKILERLRRTFLLSNYTIALVSAGLAAAFFWYAGRNKARLSNTTYEVYLLPAALDTLVSLTYLCKEIGPGTAYTLYTGLCTAAFLVLSLAFPSRVLWTGCLLALMGWFGAFSTVHSHGNLFIGLNYPMRFTIFGLLMAGISWLQAHTRLASLRDITYHFALIICFTGLWGVSVFGNFGSLDAWNAVRQTQMLPYAVTTGLALGGALYFAIRRSDAALRDYSILFLLVHLYTRYFEYFWGALNKGLFFLFLAVSFGLLARWLSKNRGGVPS